MMNVLRDAEATAWRLKMMHLNERCKEMWDTIWIDAGPWMIEQLSS
jgi:hypothetical protein